MASAPIASALLERFISHSPLSRRWVLALLLGLGGSALLCLAKLTSAPEDLLSTLWGLGLGLVAGTSYAVYSWVAHRLMGAGISRAAAMGSVFGAGGLLLLPVLILTGAPLLASPQAFWVASYMALIPMFAGYLLFGCGLTRVSPSTATTIALVEPAVATLLGSSYRRGRALCRRLGRYGITGRRSRPTRPSPEVTCSGAFTRCPALNFAL